MTADPFLRLALIALTSLYIVALALVQRWLGWAPAVAAFAGGLLLAAALSLELQPDRRPDRERLLHRLRFKPEVQRELRRQGRL